MGCGNGVFSIYFTSVIFSIKDFLVEKMTFSDVCPKAVSNTYTNVCNFL